MEIHDQIQILQIATMLIAAFAASSGFWMFIQKRNDTSKQNNKLLMGLAHWKIVNVGMEYINRGWITHDEYQNLRTYLYDPYIEMGGNGLAKRIMDGIDELPIKEVTEPLVPKPRRKPKDYPIKDKDI